MESINPTPANLSEVPIKKMKALHIKKNSKTERLQ